MTKELKALEIIKNAPTIYVGCGSDIYTRYPFECREIEKALKGLEIIKKKRVDVGSLLICFEKYNLRRYNAYAKFADLKPLSKKENELLKEILK